MKLKGYHFGIALVATILGIMFALQYQSVDTYKDPTIQRTTQLSQQVEEKKKALEELQTKVDKMHLQLEKVAAKPETKSLQEELTVDSIMAGITPVKGPGLQVTLNDSSVSVQPGQNPNLYVLHDEDVLKVLNELKAAGAEALAINDQRLVATSEIRCIGPTILTNGNKRLAAPFVINCIGNPDTLYNALFMKGGVAEQLKFWGIQVAAKKMQAITLPSYVGGKTSVYDKKGE